jgi:hypothetical protein
MSGKNNDHPSDSVWPPLIAHQLLDTSVVLTKAQLNHIRYRWFYAFLCLWQLSVAQVNTFRPRTAGGNLPHTN